MRFQASQTFFLRSNIFPHVRIDLPSRELFAHLCEINLGGGCERERHVPLLKADLFFRA
jgi:hypothetical protein